VPTVAAAAPAAAGADRFALAAGRSYGGR
jgi:hypothetical protein